MAAKYENSGDTVINNAFKFNPNEVVQRQENYQDGGALSPCSRNSATRKLLGTTSSTSTWQGKVIKVKSGVPVKKVVSKRSLRCKSKQRNKKKVVNRVEESIDPEKENKPKEDCIFGYNCKFSS